MARQVFAQALDEGTGERHGTTKAARKDRLLVENTGVEPVTSCMPCKRSSQLS
jgi:hypothetical protein